MIKLSRNVFVLVALAVALMYFFGVPALQSTSITYREPWSDFGSYVKATYEVSNPTSGISELLCSPYSSDTYPTVLVELDTTVSSGTAILSSYTYSDVAGNACVDVVPGSYGSMVLDVTFFKVDTPVTDVFPTAPGFETQPVYVSQVKPVVSNVFSGILQAINSFIDNLFGGTK